MSILMPVYNCALYLTEAIDSILNQTFTNFELIVLDDGSTDGSAGIAKSYSDSRIVYHCNEKNIGLANNLNVGLRMAKGKYIARMDGDDISLPERLQTQFDFLESHPDIDLCSCGLQMFGYEDAVWVREFDPEAVKITMMFFSPVLHATSVWRRNSFEKNNLYYNQDAFPAEDYDLWARAIFFCKLINMPDVLYMYRIHGIQVTKTDISVNQKVREVRINYIRNALPGLEKSFYTDFVDKFISAYPKTLEQISELKSIGFQLIDVNKNVRFFHQRLLRKRLNKYYQSFLMTLLESPSENDSYVRIILKLKTKNFLKWTMFKLLRK